MSFVCNIDFQDCVLIALVLRLGIDRQRESRDEGMGKRCVTSGDVRAFPPARDIYPIVAR